MCVCVSVCEREREGWGGGGGGERKRERKRERERERERERILADFAIINVKGLKEEVIPHWTLLTICTSGKCLWSRWNH